ncbi:putative cytochrome p450 [Phaeomoniella chlamydospora]|uniref:Putative cytochrome p450 n=1 Tax=Phaeomoniella chlamydospora TaxID=158046 RepID=A0A0G2DU34_PHACM|nr:putative cytochrome p450 [Phaeomoniella chlamydospora]
MWLADLSNFHITASISAIVVFCVVYAITTTYLNYRKLRHINGPLLAKISPIWMFYYTYRGTLYLAVEDALKKYGSPVVVGPDVIVTDDPVIQRHMAAPRSPYVKGRWFKGMKFDPRMDNLLSMSDEKAHTELRAKLMPGYTGKEVPDLESDMDDRIIELVDLIRRDYVDKNEAMDFAELVSYFTLDVLTKIAFGRSLGFLIKNQDLYDYHKSTAAFYPFMELSSNHPTVLAFLNSRAMKGAAPKPTDKIGFGAIIGEVHKAVAERFAPDGKKIPDMLGSFINHGLTQQECEVESLLQILAGADSTATALRTTFLFILTNPTAYAKLRNEVIATVATGNAVYPVITSTQTKELPYLQACIKEGLRMFMPLQGLAGRVSPPGGDTINGVFIPGGIEVGISTYAMNHRRDFYGPDADTFRPERWLDNDPASIKEYERTNELVFGAGRSTCLGKGIAMMELGKAIFEV